MKTSDPKVMQKIFAKKFKAVADNIDESLIEIGERGVNYLKLESPVDSGRLRGSMSYLVNKKVYTPIWDSENKDGDELKKKKEKDSVIIGTNVIYAPSVEYLAKNGSAGFMYKAYKQTKKVAKDIFKKGMQKGMKK